MLSAAEQRLFADIGALGIAYQLVEHEPVFTVEESSRLDRDIQGAHTKNLFLRDESGGFWLVTIPAQMRIDLKLLPRVIDRKRVSFAKADDMLRLLGITPGSVTPLAAINDGGCAVTVVLDKSLCSADRVNVHPLRNDATLGLSPDDLGKLLAHWRHDPVIVVIPFMS